jgi:toxin ParE1/3/4
VKILWTDASLKDLESIEDYIAADNPKAAVRHVLLLIDSVRDLLSESPAIGRPGRLPHTRELVIPSTKYIVAYRVRNKTVQILRVLHGAGKWPERL